MKRFLSLVLALIFCFMLIACENANDPTDDDKPSNDGNTDGNEETPPEIVDKVYTLSSDYANIKMHGRTSVSSDGLVCDASASGIEFNAYIEGDLKVTLNIFRSSYVDETMTNEAYFTLYVDGVRSEERIKASGGESTLTLASFEQGAVRNVKLIKQTEAHCSLCTIKSIEFRGYFEEKPIDKELLIEFIGDSITAGYGNLCTVTSDPNRGQAIMQDTTKAYAYLTAEKLGADASIICCSGMGIAKGWRPFTADKFFAADSYYRSTDTKFTAERVPDVVVINLGTNDQNKNADSADLMEKVPELINLIRTTYGEDVPIVWAHGMMGEGKWTYINLILKNKCGGESKGIYSIELPRNSEGGGGHPGLSAHDDAAERIVSFLKEKNILK